MFTTMAKHSQDETCTGETGGADTLAREHLQPDQVKQQPNRCKVQQQEQHRQQEQQCPEQRISLSGAGRVADTRATGGRKPRSLPSSEGNPTTAATNSGATLMARTGSKLLLPLSSSSASPSTRESVEGLSLYGVALSAAQFSRSDSSAEAAALKIEQELSAGRGEAASGNRSGRSNTTRWCCCTVLRKMCCGGLQYLEHLKARSLDAIMYGFERYAAIVYKYSWVVLGLSLLLTAALSVGVFRRTIERNVYKLYSLKVSPSQKTKENISSAFPPDRVLQIIVESKNKDILQEQALQQLADLQAAVQHLTLERDTVKVDEYNCRLDKTFDRSKFPATFTYQDICAVDSQNQCFSTSVLDIYPDPASYGRMPLLVQSHDDPMIINLRTTRIFRIDSVLADYELEPVAPGQPEQRVINARVALLRMNFRGDEDWRPYVAAYEDLVTQYLLDHRKLTPDLYLTPRTDRSAADELHRASTLDLPHWMMLVGAGVLVTIYTSAVNSSLTYRTKLLPSAMGALASFLGYLGGAGAVYLCGVYHTAPADATPFLALGIGVDDLFVIINAYSLTYLYKDPQQRVISALRDAGLSITLTTLTNVITFMIGAVCPYYSISGFCLVTAGALCWGYVMCLTFFLAVLCIDARREARKQTLLHALLCVNTPRQKNRVAVADSTPVAAAGGAFALGPATPAPKVDETVGKSGERVTAGDAVQEKSSKRGGDKEDVLSMAAEDPSAVGAKGLGEAAETAGDAKRVVTTGGTVALPRVVSHHVIEAGNTFDFESSPVSCYGEELLTTHELAALMVLYQKRKHLRSVQGTPSTQAGGHFGEKNEESGYVSLLQREVQSSSTACEVTPHSSSREHESPQDSSQCPSRPKDEAAAHNEKTSACERDKLSNTIDQSGRSTGTKWQDRRRSLVDSTLFKPSSSWHAGEGTVHPALPSNSRPNIEETAHLLQRFQQELEENPDRLLTLYHPEPRGNPGRIWRLFFREYYARLLGSTWVKLLILLVFLTLTGLSIYGSTLLEYGFSLKDITPNASFLRDFYEKHEKYFSDYGDEVVVFFPGTAQLQNRSVQREYLAVVTEIKGTDKIAAVSDGLSLFLNTAMHQLPDGGRPEFLFALRTWLQTDPMGHNFERDFQFSPEGELKWAKFTCWMRLLDNSTARYNLLQHLKHIVQTAGPHLRGDVYSGLAVIWESDPHVLSFTLTNLAIALAAILGVSLLLIPNLASAALVVAAVTFVDLCLFGLMGFIHLHLSMISMVTLLISVGYSVDFTIHVAHTFTHCVGSSLQDRISETMVVMGAPVTHGMISTLLAVMALSGSPRYILQVFFKMMLMVVTLSYAAGMILLPTVLTLVGPTGRHRRRRAAVEKAHISPGDPSLSL